MVINRRIRTTLALSALAVAMAYANSAISAKDDDDDVSENYVKQGFAISPVLPVFQRKDRKLVGLGSYIVNTTGCNDCHTHPSYLPGHDPFAGQPEQINAAQYLSGGRRFLPSPFVSANLTPDASGKPAGLTFDQFRTTLRTGHNPLDPPGEILQIMPWPVFGKKTDGDLRAIYEYLRAIPSLPDNPNPGP